LVIRILLKTGFPDIHSAKALVTAINCNGVRWKFSEFMVVSVDLELILGCKIFKRSLISEQRQLNL